MHIKPILKRLISQNAVIFPTAFSGAYAAYLNGDRRRRPICWLEAKQFKDIQFEGVLQSEGEGFRVKESALRRTVSGSQLPVKNFTAENYSSDSQGQTQSQTGHASQHRAMEEREQFVFGKSVRSIAVNIRTSPLRALSKSRPGQAQKVLTSAEVEAGEQFAKDYEFANMSSVSTQNYESAPRGQGKGHAYGGLSDSRIDARNRVMGALKAMGPGLDRVVTSVCVNELSLERLERTEDWMKGGGFTVLKLGLQRLVNFYGTEPGRKPLSNWDSAKKSVTPKSA